MSGLVRLLPALVAGGLTGAATCTKGGVTTAPAPAAGEAVVPVPGVTKAVTGKTSPVVELVTAPIA